MGKFPYQEPCRCTACNNRSRCADLYRLQKERDQLQERMNHLEEQREHLQMQTDQAFRSADEIEKIYDEIWNHANTIHLYSSLAEEESKSITMKEKQKEIIRTTEEILNIIYKYKGNV